MRLSRSFKRYATLKVRGPMGPPGRGALGAGCCELTPRPTLLRAGLIWFLSRRFLPRKEVIQPHLPVRLPCYDFTPLTLHTFDASAPWGFGRRLRVQTTRVV